MSASLDSPEHTRGNSLAAVNILVVDDDDLFRESIQRNLIDHGYGVTAFESGSAALNYISEGGAGDLVLLDWKMPGLSGIEVLRRLRDREISIPVIFLTVLGDQIYEEAALIGGAVDFVEKSKSFTILQRRIELTLEGQASQRAPQHESNVKVGPLEILVGERQIYWKGDELQLTVSEFQIIHLLATHPGEYLDYRQIYDVVHGEGFAAGEGETGFRTNVRAFVKRIRQKFKAADSSFDQIANFPGFGYRWEKDA